MPQWASFQGQLDPAFRDAYLKEPLLEPSEHMTIEQTAKLQAGEEGSTVRIRAFLTLQLREASVPTSSDADDSAKQGCCMIL